LVAPLPEQVPSLVHGPGVEVARERRVELPEAAQVSREEARLAARLLGAAPVGLHAAPSERVPVVVGAVDRERRRVVRAALVGPRPAAADERDARREGELAFHSSRHSPSLSAGGACTPPKTRAGAKPRGAPRGAAGTPAR